MGKTKLLVAGVTLLTGGLLVAGPMTSANAHDATPADNAKPPPAADLRNSRRVTMIQPPSDASIGSRRTRVG